MPTISLPRPAERVAIVSLVLVFLCGAVTGAMLMSRIIHPAIHSPQATGMLLSTGEWKSQLDLSDEQMRQLTSILDDFSHYYDNLLADGNTRIMGILNAEQKLKYQRLLHDHKK